MSTLPIIPASAAACHSHQQIHWYGMLRAGLPAAGCLPLRRAGLRTRRKDLCRAPLTLVCSLPGQAAQSAFGANSKWSSWAKKGPAGTTAAVPGSKKGPAGGRASAAASGDVDPGRADVMDIDEPAPVAAAKPPSAAMAGAQHQKSWVTRHIPYSVPVYSAFTPDLYVCILAVLRVETMRLCRRAKDQHSTGRHAVEQRPGSSDHVEGPGSSVGARPTVCQE